ncbi:MAG TPA: hypothetical protein VFY04_04500 [Solirubrobacterales bacterium]|nr:hypothetical protein [Solirubrobacterales bacterium]
MSARCDGSPPDERCLAAHDDVAAEFWERLWPAYVGAIGWHDRIWAAGVAMMRFLQEDPPRAHLLFVAVDGAGPEGLKRRDEIVKRFADMLDDAPRRNGTPGLPRSRATAEIAAGAIYRMLLDKVQDGAIERGEEFLAELIYMAVMPYLGADVAESELAVQSLH